MSHGQAAQERARTLVLRYGWNTTSYQILNPGIQLWFSTTEDAVVGYVATANTRVVAGAPVCAEDAVELVTREFEREAAAKGERVCYFGAEGRLDVLYRESDGHSSVLLGAQPSWDPHEWPRVVESHASLRAQLHRAHNKGVVVVLWPSERARHHPALAACLKEWLATRGLPPLHFLVEPETLDTLEDRRVFVAERNGIPVGFLVASPVAARNGWLVEQFVRGHHAPNGTAELMIDTAIRWMAYAESTYVTLGLAPLSQRAGLEVARTEPVWLRVLLAWTRAHGRRFYNFDGLDAFKAKFQPDRWEPVFAIANERRFSIRSLYAIAAAFTNGRPVATVLSGLGKAVQQEWQWLRTDNPTH